MSPAAAIPQAATAVPASADAPVIDRENPWPGLVSFPEAAEAYFNGRDAERDDLLRLIRRETLTLLYGLSGLGKSSLLNAGLFPLLRQEHFLPVYVRLDHEETSPPHDEQVRHALLAECAERGVEPPAAREGESVWELLHHADGGFWDAKNYPVTPVLVIDQFEEIFTLGMATPARRERSRRFMAELGDLIDNRPPDVLVERLEGDPDAAAAYAFAHPGCKVVVSMREDFLPELGQLGEHTRSTFQNYLRLLRMRGDTAMNAILSTGGALVDPGVARAIVYFLAKVPAERQPATDLSAVEVEPALLSLVCRELNQRRKDAGLKQIDLGLLDVSQTAILTKFYQDSFEGMQPGVRVFVEEELLTEKGYRNAAAEDDALELPDVTEDALDALVARRLIRKEERFGTARIELTHDVLTDVVRDSRDRRRAEEEALKRRREQDAAAAARRAAVRRRTVGAVVAGVLLVLAAVGWSYSRAAAAAAEAERLMAKDSALALRDRALAMTVEKMKGQRVALARQQARTDSMETALEAQEAAVEAAQTQVARQRDSVRLMMAAAGDARRSAQLSAREALVGAETADYYLDISGRMLRRQAADRTALDSTAGRTIAQAEAIQRAAEERQRASVQLERAVAGVLCTGAERNDKEEKSDREEARAALRAAVDSALGSRTLCTSARPPSVPTRAGTSAMQHPEP